ncbi:hypothetical protein [Pseudomonas rhizoryzae]|uniref:hypothetical protein n=1 Tax=Pseudomonas rhizoryzae TaxID=2571129 RepID=UPI0007366C2A|nr:hypothetical protein [Pseudomonas rhizoryzae]KTT28197.1 lipoprotein [Pseudomonas psychrotolerans]KTT71254.1 lipoprotein [Pseudomonas psychrotolerans]
MTSLRPLLFLAGLLLAACASQPPLPSSPPPLAHALVYQVERQSAEGHDVLLLAIQPEGANLRFSLFDPLGVPQARQQFIQGAWQADGLLPPNPQARAFFAVLLFALTPAEQLPWAYAAGDWRQAADGSRTLGDWQVRYPSADRLELRAPDRPSYRLTLLPESAP